MGYRVENYSRSDLRHVALPGQAVSTLFWVLPLGAWSMGELEKWWDHFTTRSGFCERLGLLLVRNTRAWTQLAGDAANLSSAPIGSDGGRLSELIPELDEDDEQPRGPHRSVLVLSGAYPQPGWAVHVTGDCLRDVRFFERVVEKAVRGNLTDGELSPILSAQSAFRARADASASPPAPPEPPPSLKELQRQAAEIDELFHSLESAEPQRTQAALDRILARRPGIPNEAVGDLRGWVGILNAFTQWLHSGEEEWLGLLAEFDGSTLAAQDAMMAAGGPQGAFLRKVRFIRGVFGHTAPEPPLVGWTETVLRPHVRGVLKAAVVRYAEEVARERAEQQVAHQLRSDAYASKRAAWEEALRASEVKYRAALTAASVAQWELGPRFLLALEREVLALKPEVGQSGSRARSLPWDAARMVGWKLRVECPDLTASHLLVAASTVLDRDLNTVLNRDLAAAELAPHAGEINGSLFADYAYLVAMTADKMSPWQATMRLLTHLLAPGTLQRLVGSMNAENVATKPQLATSLLHRWGWVEQRHDTPRPLAGCVAGPRGEPPALVKPFNEARISVESCLKDLVLVVLADLGWSGDESESRIRVQCPDFRRSRHGPWTDELEHLTGGAALVLLRGLLPLTQSRPAVEDFCARAGRLLAELNERCHDPPPPPPSKDDLVRLGDLAVGIVRDAGAFVGEMPWHFRPTQVFGSGPAVATGHAWSHSHAEERLIRVMLWAGEGSSSELLVWNKSRTNPVMTDAKVVRSRGRRRT